MKRTALTIIAAALLQFTAGAQAQSVILPSLEFSHDAISASMAGATMLDDADDIRATYQNWAPSGTSYADLRGQNTFAGKFTVKAGGGYGSSKPYEIVEDFGSQAYRYSPSDMYFHAGFGYRFTDFLGIEATAKYASSKLAPRTETGGFCADVLVKAWVKGFKFAAGVTNAGPDVQGFKLPAAVAVAAGYDRTFEDGGASHRVQAELDFKYFLYGEAGGSAGISYTYDNRLSIRGGYHAGGIVGNHASVGIGFKIKGIHIDGTYLAGGQITNSFCIGLGYEF